MEIGVGNQMVSSEINFDKTQEELFVILRVHYLITF